MLSIKSPTVALVIAPDAILAVVIVAVPIVALVIWASWIKASSM